MSNPISPELKTGTIAELLVQMRLLQYDVQAAPPLKDSGNDLIAIRGNMIRTIQVKATAGQRYDVPEEKKRYHILAAVRLEGDGREISLDRCDIFLIRKEELDGLPRDFSQIETMKLGPVRVDELFPPESLPNLAPC